MKMEDINKLLEELICYTDDRYDKSYMCRSIDSAYKKGYQKALSDMFEALKHELCRPRYKKVS